MYYVSTRNSGLRVKASEAIYLGISEDGGLFVPETFPKLNFDMIKHLSTLNYVDRAVFIMKLFLDEFSNEELREYATKAYSRFDDNCCPVVKVEDKIFYLELFHGPTCAFKDFALTMLPYLLKASKEKLGIKDKTLILTATSGDTGKAALSGFQDVEGTDVLVFYPNEGVSTMQELQMRTQKGNNVGVYAVRGNFDDCQTAVKKVFCDPDMKAELAKRGYSFSSANSINWGRLLPQIVYYFSAYCDLWESGEIDDEQEINFVVPTGNFGDILAGYYAKKIGLPVKNLICASNSNNVLTDFFTEGTYDINREFFKTISPSMDILISSNLERLIFELMDRDSDKVKELYSKLKEDGKFSVAMATIESKIPYIISGYATESSTIATISNYYEDYDYLMDPHTAVATEVLNEYLSELSDFDEEDFEEEIQPTVVLSTAHPYKFALDVYNAISASKLTDCNKALKKLNFFSGEDIPAPLEYLFVEPIRFSEVISSAEIAAAVLKYLDKKN